MKNGADAADVRSGAKLKRFAFTYDFKLLLLQCVRQTNADRAVHGKKDELFNKVREIFMAHVPSTTWICHQHPSLKTLRDKFRAMVVERKEQVACNEVSSGNVEELTPLETLLDDLMLEVKEHEEGLRREKDELSAMEQALVRAGEDIKYRAMKRRHSSDSGTESSECTRKKARASLNDIAEWNEMTKAELQCKREQQVRDLALREKELALQRQRLEDDRKEREIYLEESRAQIDSLKL